MVAWVASRDFPHRRFRGVGAILVILGLAVAGVGLASVVYTEYYYGVYESVCNKPSYFFPTDPCDFDAIIYSRVGGGVWGGFLILLAGAIATCFYDGDRYIKTRRDGLGVMSFLLVFPVCPAVIAMAVLQIIFTENVFWVVTANSETIVIDSIMFILPLVFGSLAFVSWCAAIAILIMVCSCADIYEDDVEIIKRYSRPNYPAPTIVNRFRPQFVPYSDVYPDADAVYGSAYGSLPPYSPGSSVYGYPQPVYMPLPPPRPQTRRMPQWHTSRRYLRW